MEYKVISESIDMSQGFYSLSREEAYIFYDLCRISFGGHRYPSEEEAVKLFNTLPISIKTNLLVLSILDEATKIVEFLSNE